MKCKLCLAKEQKFRIIKETKYSYCIVLRWAIKLGHIMTVPKRHVESFSELKKDEIKDLLELTEEMANFLMDKKLDDPIIARNFGENSSQKHIHFQICPSKTGFRGLIAKFDQLKTHPNRSLKELENMKKKILELP